MATLSYSFVLKNFLLSSSVLLILVSCFLKKSHALESSKDGKIDSNFHTVDINSLLPAPVCSPSTATGSNKRQSTLKVTHRHGPCSQIHQDKASPAAATPSLSEVLSYDQSRVNSIQAQVNRNSNTNKIEQKKADLPAQSTRSYVFNNYIVTVGLGTPRRTLSLEFDTGSDLTWTQCQPCSRSCYKQRDPIFNPSSSSSYSNVSCNSVQCSQSSTILGNSRSCASTTCAYNMQYADESFSEGFFGKDKLTISETDVFPNFLFGCGQNNQGTFGNTAGLLGFGRSPLSIVSQTAEKYGKYFSYCLPSTSSLNGYLTLGKNSGVNSSNVKFTPFATSEDTSLYFIDILSISVGGCQLLINQTVFLTAGTIIDSGTVITRLPPSAYSKMKSAFRKLMAKYPRAPAYSFLNTCYDLSSYTTVTIPTISFTFTGNVKVDLAPSGILFPVSKSHVCLAFSRNLDAYDLAIFGNAQQKTLEVVYDVAGGKLGFGPAGCK